MRRSFWLILFLASCLCFQIPAAGGQTGAVSQRISERAYQDREILYELQSPESHAFRITHDYTARTQGERYYLNIVRAGSHVSDPES
ncbi:MAG TPA: hypothetical protein VFV34_28045, partial [Blastocatellia bacterium]|nr:hypothetical protein [Blastocatellia bacterium]